MRPNGFRLPAGLVLPGLLPQRAAKSRATRLIEQPQFGANPGALRMFLYVPPALPKKAPLVVMLHGCTQNAALYDDGAGWSVLAARAGFAVLAPEQSIDNNMKGCFNWFLPGDTARGEGEAASIRQMIAHAVTAHDLDPARIFITGLSAGGGMTAAMLGAYPELFAGGAIIAGLPAGAAANVAEALHHMRNPASRTPTEWAARVPGTAHHSGPWPRLSIWQGDADAVVHPANADALIAQWLHLHGLDPDSAQESAEGRHRRRFWTGRDGKVMVEAFTLAGMGHGTPVKTRPRSAMPDPHFPAVGISSTARIAAFWGIATQEQEETHKAAPRSAPHLVGGSVRAVIQRALQSAGLLKT
jgi:poly(hydroxyalkanoate) depolymerase family esterase